MESQSEEISISDEIKQLFESDQKDRQDFSKDPDIGRAIYERDEQRLERAREIITKGKVSDPHELNMLAFIFQHGKTVEDYQQALNLASQAVEAGLLPKHSLIPHAIDKIMIQEQLDNGVSLKDLKQKYGTQTRFDETGKPFRPPLDETVSKEEFEKFGIDQ